MKADVLEILDSFNINGKVVDYFPIGNGHINSTFLCGTDTGHKYILQRINNSVFKDVDLLMSNYFKVSEYFKSIGFEAIEIIKTKNDKYYYNDPENPHRLYKFIENTIWFEEVKDLTTVFKAGEAFGKLHKALKGFDANELGEVIPNFHNTKQRYLNLLDAIKEDKLGRVKTCLPEIEVVKSFEKEFDKVVSAIEKNEIPLVVTHNDPKINNVLFDRDTKEFRTVIDLDTVMPGSYLYDFGDALRSLFTGDNEDSEDLSKLVVNYDIFDAYAKGYVGEMKNVLVPKEKELLAFSSFLLSIECGMRFLEDYIRGDVYFKTRKPNHNLLRARTQLTLAKDIFKNLDKLNEIVKNIYNS